MRQAIETANAIHADLYRHFLWQSDEKLFGKGEQWDRLIMAPSGKYVGDCDSFACEVDYRIAHVIPLTDRHFAVCKMERGKGLYDHCALAIVDGDDIWISECNSPELVKREHLPYTNWYWALGALNEDWVAF